MKNGWLDTEVRAILGAGWDKSIASAADGFSLLLLSEGTDRGRAQEVLAELAKCGTANATSWPFVLRQELTLDDALAGQFALACCDCVSALVRDEVVWSYEASDWDELFSEVLGSAEFAWVDILVKAIPATQAGRDFLWQFMGLAVGVALPLKTRVIRKKARLMKHCAETIGGVISDDA